MPPRKRLGQLLTELKVIDEAQLQSALGHQKQWGGKIGAIVVEKGFCSEDQLVAVLSQHLGIATVKLESSQVDPRAVKAVSRAVAERLHVFAYEVVGAGRSEVVSVAMSDPTDLSAVDQLAFHTGKPIEAPPEPEEPMALETPTTLQGWKEGPQAPGIDWREKTGPVEAQAKQAPATNESLAGDTEPVPEEQAPSDWHDGAEGTAREAEQAPAEWHAGEGP